ncbi:MAG: prepilin-type N-terminal cleavage/methylation domain-containing protein [Parcubacteria group bacterium]|jgi:Tfp pilus assembly protein PilV
MKNKNYKAFSLVEVLMATFVFSVIMVGVAGAFSSSVFSYKSGKNIQQNLEQAQFAMNLMTKTIRTSSIVRCYDGSGWTVPVGTCPAGIYDGIMVYDYSQAKCIQYLYNAQGKITVNYGEINDAANMAAGCKTWGTAQDMALNINELLLRVTQSAAAGAGTPATVGKVTISMEACSNAGCAGNANDRAILQTTVSLRDYSVSGL